MNGFLSSTIGAELYSDNSSKLKKLLIFLPELGTLLLNTCNCNFFLTDVESITYVIG